jgi:hypothetical protein
MSAVVEQAWLRQASFQNLYVNSSCSKLIDSLQLVSFFQKRVGLQVSYSSYAYIDI